MTLSTDFVIGCKGIFSAYAGQCARHRRSETGFAQDATHRIILAFYPNPALGTARRLAHQTLKCGRFFRLSGLQSRVYFEICIMPERALSLRGHSDNR